MAKTLVAYFSASGVTKKVAECLASVCGADLCEIVPETIYTKEDLDWTNTQSRSTLEMQDKSCRPAICCSLGDTSAYDTVFIGFPVWWGREPSVVDTFMDQADLCGKKIVPFCTSGSGDAAGATENMKAILADKATVIDGIRFAADVTAEDLKACVTSLNL